MSKEVKIMGGIAVVVIGIGALLFLSQGEIVQHGSPVDSQSLVRETSHRTGSNTPKVTIVEFGDYECPGCAVVNPVVKQLIEEYKDKPVSFVYRHFPLPQHAKAPVAAQAAEAAGEQGKFWEFHNKLYENRDKWMGNNDHRAAFLQFADE